jgi:hypothetical protein
MRRRVLDGFSDLYDGPPSLLSQAPPVPWPHVETDQYGCPLHVLAELAAAHEEDDQRSLQQAKGDDMADIRKILADALTARTYVGKRDPETGACTITVHGMIGNKAGTWPLDPRLDIENKSPTGFEWGYGGSGPAQTAIAIIAEATRNDDLARRYYQRFKGLVAQVPREARLEFDSIGVNKLIHQWMREDLGKPLMDQYGKRVYDEGDVLGAPDGHMPLAGTDVEIVAYRMGEQLCLLVNKGGVCVYRATLHGAMRDLVRPSQDDDNFVIRDLRDNTQEV